MAVVATLRIAPVKGLATVTRDRVVIGRGGVAEDRRVFLLDATGAVVTMRSHPELVKVTPDLDLEDGVLSARMPDDTVVSTALDGVGEAVAAQLFGKDRSGRVIAGDVADAMSEIAGEPLRVVLADTTGVGWDEGPVSIISRASIAAVGGDSDSRRYRMLVELDDAQPYEEDGWVGQDVNIGTVRLGVTQKLGRCVVITRSPSTGEADWDGLGALARQRDGDLCLGVIADVLTPGEIRVGDAVVADEAADRPPQPATHR